MADKREFLVVIDGRESVSPAAGKAERALDGLGDQAKKTEQDFTGLDRKMREHADTIAHLRKEIAETGDVGLFKELGKNERSLKKLQGLRKSLADAAGDAAPDMAVSLSGRLGPLLARLPVSGPMGIALTTAAVAAAAPVGAVIAGAITGGVGVGGVIGGFALVKNDPRVKASTASLAAEIGGQLEQAAMPLAPAVAEAVDDAADEFSKLQGKFRAIFANSAKFVGPLISGAATGLSKIVDGFEKLNRSAGPVVREIGAGLGNFGAEVGRLLESLADNGPEAADAMRNLFITINGGVRVIGGVVNGLTELYGWIVKVNALRSGDFGTLARYLNAEAEIAGAVDETTSSLRGMDVGARAAAAAIEALTMQQHAAADGALSAAEANLRYRESLLAAKEAVDGKKRVSLEEERALYSLIRATNENTAATDNSKVSASQAERQFRNSRQAVINMAEKMGYSRTEAHKLADQMLKIPNVKRTVNVDAKAAQNAVADIQKRINNVKGKTVFINVRTEMDFNGEIDQGAMHGGVRAAGGPVKAGMQYTVGEQGRETFVAPRDGYIINNRDTAMLAAGGAPSASFAAAPMRGGGSWSLSIIPGADRMLRELISKALLFELRTDAGTRQQMKAVLT